MHRNTESAPSRARTLGATNGPELRQRCKQAADRAFPHVLDSEAKTVVDAHMFRIIKETKSARTH